MFCRNTLCTSIKIVGVKRLSCQVAAKSKHKVVRTLAILRLLYKFLTGEEINPLSRAMCSSRFKFFSNNYQSELARPVSYIVILYSLLHLNVSVEYFQS